MCLFQLIEDQWRHMALEILINVGSGDDLLPHDINPLLWATSLKGAGFIKISANAKSAKIQWATLFGFSQRKYMGDFYHLSIYTLILALL